MSFWVSQIYGLIYEVVRRALFEITFRNDATRKGGISDKRRYAGIQNSEIRKLFPPFEFLGPPGNYSEPFRPMAFLTSVLDRADPIRISHRIGTHTGRARFRQMAKYRSPNLRYAKGGFQEGGFLSFGVHISSGVGGLVAGPIAAAFSDEYSAILKLLYWERLIGIMYRIGITPIRGRCRNMAISLALFSRLFNLPFKPVSADITDFCNN